MSHASLSKFYNSVVKSGTSGSNRKMELEPFPVRTRYNISFSFPSINSLKNGINKSSGVDSINVAQVSSLNELVNLLLQDIQFPTLSYGGLSAGDANLSDEKHGGIGGQFSTLNEADHMTAAAPDIKMSFLNTKFPILERYFLPWIRHCTDTQSTNRYKVYPFIRGCLDIHIYNDNSQAEPNESDVLCHYQFEDVYPYEISLSDIHCGAFKNEVDVRTVSFDYNNFRLVETYSTQAQMFGSLKNNTPLTPTKDKNTATDNTNKNTDKGLGQFKIFDPLTNIRNEMDKQNKTDENKTSDTSYLFNPSYYTKELRDKAMSNVPADVGSGAGVANGAGRGTGAGAGAGSSTNGGIGGLGAGGGANVGGANGGGGTGSGSGSGAGGGSGTGTGGGAGASATGGTSSVGGTVSNR